MRAALLEAESRVQSSCPEADTVETVYDTGILFNLVFNSPASPEVIDMANDLANKLASCSVDEILTFLEMALEHLDEHLEENRKDIVLRGNSKVPSTTDGLLIIWSRKPHWS